MRNQKFIDKQPTLVIMKSITFGNREHYIKSTVCSTSGITIFFTLFAINTFAFHVNSELKQSSKHLFVEI